MWKNGTVIEEVRSYQTYSVATSACQVVQACIWNSVAQLAKAWHSEQAVLEAGTVVRTLALGHQSAGFYQSRSRAAYWDGRNAAGEPVASGVYFYTLSAGNFSATRKMVIRK